MTKYGGQKTKLPGAPPLKTHVNTQGKTSQRHQICPHCAQAFNSAGELAAHGKQVHGRVVTTADVASSEGNS
jgi:hypothetical protein